MARRNISKNRKINNLIMEEIFINEIFNQEIPTNYKVIDYGEYITFQFKTDSNNEYDLELHYSEEDSNTMFVSGKKLSDYNLKIDHLANINAFDIAFTLNNVNNKNDPDEFEKETYLNEYLELFGKIIYILKRENKRKSDVDLFIVGYSTRNKNDIYMRIVENNFSNDFHIEKGISKYHIGGNSMFLIKK